MVTTHMVEAKMHNKIFKYGLLLSVAVFSFFTFSSFAFANYGSGSYGSDLYSTTISKNSSSGSTVLSRYNNLISTGNLQAAEDLRKEFPNQIPNQIISPSLSTSTSTSTTTTFTFTKTLKQKTTSSDVKELQKYLNSKGYTVAKIGAGSIGKETNYFGPATKKAVIAFQKANGLTPDGIVGKMTMAKMK